MPALFHAPDSSTVTYRHANRDNAEGTAPDWSEWKQGTLVVISRRPVKAGKRSHNFPTSSYAQKDAPFLITIAENPFGLEFMPDDCENSKQGLEVCVEGYRLEIKDFCL